MLWALGLLGALIVIGGALVWIESGRAFGIALVLVGMAVLFESISVAVGLRNKLKTTLHYVLYLVFIIVLGVIVGVVAFDLPGIFIFRFWEYPEPLSPTGSLAGYGAVAFSWGLCFLILHQTYQLLYHLIHSPPRRLYNPHLIYVGPLGLTLLVLGLTLPAMGITPITSAVIAVVGAWLTLEGLELERKRPTLLTELLAGNFRPLAAILISAIALGIIYEAINLQAPVQNWIYANVPFADTALLGAPVLVIVFWSWLSIIFLSLENILIRSANDVWE